MKVARVVDRVAAVVSSASMVLATSAVLWLMVSTVTHVSLRQSGRPGIAGIVELNALMMVGVVFLGLAAAQRSGSHVAVRLFVMRLPQRVQAVLSAVSMVLAAVLVWWLLWAAAAEVSTAWSTGERLAGVVPLPLWPAKAVLGFGLAALLLEVVNSLLKQFFGDAGGDRGGDPADPREQPSGAVDTGDGGVSIDAG